MWTKKLIYITILFITSISINAQVDIRNIEFTGKVCDNKGSAITGVPVTDGYNIVVTNQKGEYRLLSNATAEFIYITIPSGYVIPMKDNSPYFYHRVDDKLKLKQKFDFILEKSRQDENKHIVIVCADPQVGFDEEIPMVEEAIKDIKSLVAQNYANFPVHGVICGDIIAEISREPKFFEWMKHTFAESNIPFFYAAGNHDMDVSGRSNHDSKKTFKNALGPTYYSFNRGKVHYIVLDDVFFIARGYASIGYLDEEQLCWLAQDLTLIPEGSTVVTSFHIPTYSREARRGEAAKEEMNKVLQNRSTLYKMLKPYNAYIFTGHEHYNENYQLADNLFEHVHAALCGIFWQAPYNSDGTPLGYAVYEFDGDKVKWYYKSVGKDKNYQFNAYLPGADKNRPDAVIANVWNYDPQWKVHWYENGVKMGEMKQYTGWDPAIVHYVDKNRENFRYKYIGAGSTDHLFSAEPADKNAKITIEVIDRFGNKYTDEAVKEE
ncbi:MAG: calcineurin-like phosphoesterase family protein [Prevotella sp.]|jgi:3',5'-cyclic AMP phosphodiesterase CpdA|nr:calcineurin-like phosphoesterase family protein [Prevotella sp.]